MTLSEIENISNNDSGFYWIFTSKKCCDFNNCTTPNDKKHINLKELSQKHKNLKNVISQNNEEISYNDIKMVLI